MKRAPVAFTLLAAFVPILFFSACGGTPDTSGSGYVKPRYQSSGYSEKDLSQVNAFVSPQARTKIYRKVAVMPFRAPVELAGASIADLLTTELLQTYKYQMVERSQMEQVLGEQALGLKGVTDSTLAMEVGKILGVQGVIVGTVPEYGMRAVGPNELPAIGLNIRMIDVLDGTVVWSVSKSGVSSETTSLSSFSETLVRLCVAALKLLFDHPWLAYGLYPRAVVESLLSATTQQIGSKTFPHVIKMNGLMQSSCISSAAAKE